MLDKLKFLKKCAHCGCSTQENIISYEHYITCVCGNFILIENKIIKLVKCSIKNQSSDGYYINYNFRAGSLSCYSHADDLHKLRYFNIKNITPEFLELLICGSDYDSLMENIKIYLLFS